MISVALEDPRSSTVLYLEDRLDPALVALYDDLARVAFRLGRMADMETPVHDQVQGALASVSHALLGRDLAAEVGVWLGDGPADEGSLFEALHGLYEQGELALGPEVREQLRSAGWAVTAPRGFWRQLPS